MGQREQDWQPKKAVDEEAILEQLKRKKKGEGEGNHLRRGATEQKVVGDRSDGDIFSLAWGVS